MLLDIWGLFSHQFLFFKLFFKIFIIPNKSRFHLAEVFERIYLPIELINVRTSCQGFINDSNFVFTLSCKFRWWWRTIPLICKLYHTLTTFICAAAPPCRYTTEASLWLLRDLLSFFSLASGDSRLRERRDCLCIIYITPAIKIIHLRLLFVLELHTPTLKLITSFTCVFFCIVCHRARSVDDFFPKVFSLFHFVVLIDHRHKNAEIWVATSHD